MQTQLRQAVVVAFGRTPYCKARKGSFAQLHPVEYGAQTLLGVLARVPQLRPEDIGDVVIAGGVESMSLVPMLVGAEDADPWLAEHRPEVYTTMGITAENIARQWGISRADMDAMAVESHRRAAQAQAGGCFDGQIIPITVPGPDGGEVVVCRDEGIRPGTTAETLAGLKPCFLENGSVTAATSSQMTDGAGFVVLMSEEKAAELGVKPLARFVSFATGGVPAEVMGVGPIEAVPKALRKAGLTLEQMDTIELNEAFASQALAVIRTLGMDPARVNPWGGAMAAPAAVTAWSPCASAAAWARQVSSSACNGSTAGGPGNLPVPRASFLAAYVKKLTLVIWVLKCYHHSIISILIGLKRRISMKELENKVALVSSSTRGIGLACAKALAEQIADELIAAGGRAGVVFFDASREESFSGMVDEVAAKEGRLDILVNNFGSTDVKTDLDVVNGPSEDFFRIVNTNLKSVYLPSKAAVYM